MSARHRTGGKARRAALPARILVFGEDANDTHAVRELLIGLRPDLEHAVKPFRSPPVLIKDARPADLPDRADRIVAVIRAEEVTSTIVGIFIHEDCDAVEPAHLALTKKIEGAFDRAGYPVHAVTPAWEMEAWWFLWPAAVKRVRASWRDLDSYQGRDVGKIVNAKEELRRALRPTGGKRTTDYRESDAPEVAKAVRELSLTSLPGGRSASYDLFRERAMIVASPRAAR